MKRVLAGILFAVVAGVIVNFPSQPVQAAATTQSIAFPMYEYPTIGTLWSDIESAGTQVPFIIANPGTGPGASVDANYTSYIANHIAAGQRVIGYVYSNYQNRPIADVIQDIDDWYDMYPNITGIFNDLIENGDANDLCYAATVYNYVKAKHPTHLVVHNPGTNIEARYEPYGDIFMNAENFYSTYQSWVPNNDGFENNAANANRFWHIVHTTSSADMADAVALTRTNNAGWVVVTDETMPNPYMAVASYWTSFLNMVNDLPQSNIPNRGLTALPSGCLDLSMATSASTAQATKATNTTVTNSVTNQDGSRVSWGDTTITYSIPSGATLTGFTEGTGWDCSTSTQKCTYAGNLAGGASTSAVQALVSVGCGYQSGVVAATVKNFANNTATANVTLTKPNDCAGSSASGGSGSGGSTAKQASTTVARSSPIIEESTVSTAQPDPDEPVSNEDAPVPSGGTNTPSTPSGTEPSAEESNGVRIDPIMWIVGALVLIGAVIVVIAVVIRRRNQPTPLYPY